MVKLYNRHKGNLIRIFLLDYIGLKKINFMNNKEYAPINAV